MGRNEKWTSDGQAWQSSAADVRQGSGLTGAKFLPVAVLLAIGTAGAQENAAGNNADDERLEEVTVTGTRVVRDGFESPTPVTVLGQQALDEMGVTVVADAVNR
ncbi:MAG: hypothetical protein RIA65_14755, partial [Woeseia sp.]